MSGKVALISGSPGTAGAGQGILSGNVATWAATLCTGFHSFCAGDPLNPRNVSAQRVLNSLGSNGLR